MNQINNIEAAGLVCITLDVHLWSGRQALKRDALIAANPSLVGLPPEGLASMGSVRICDPTEVRVFARLKSEAQRYLEDHGLPLLGSIAIPQNDFAKVYAKLSDIQKRFDRDAMSLLARYDAQAQKWKDQWCQNNPGHAHLLRRMPDAQTVVGKLRFGFHCYAVQPPVSLSESDAVSEANKAYADQLTGLKGELLRDIGAEATDLLTKYMVCADGSSTREKITQKTLRPLKRIASKLHAFAFIDTTIKPLADMIDTVLSQTPTDGPIVGQSLLMIYNLAVMLSNPVSAARIAELTVERGIDTVVDEFEFMMREVAATETQSVPDAPIAIKCEETFDLDGFGFGFGFGLGEVATAMQPAVAPVSPSAAETFSLGVDLL